MTKLLLHLLIFWQVWHLLWINYLELTGVQTLCTTSTKLSSSCLSILPQVNLCGLWGKVKLLFHGGHFVTWKSVPIKECGWITAHPSPYNKQLKVCARLHMSQAKCRLQTVSFPAFYFFPSHFSSWACLAFSFFFFVVVVVTCIPF